MSASSDKAVVLYTAGTPNGYVPTILLEELKTTYGAPEYDIVKMSISDAEIGKVHYQVKSEWFLKINPNGRIPAITHDGFNVIETSSILLYIAEHFDKDRKFSRDPVADPKGYSEELQWLFFIHGGVGPMLGQAGHFTWASPTKIPYALKRYVDEAKRLYGVLEGRLEGREYILDSYSIVDIKAFGWLRIAPRIGVDLDEFPNIKAWLERIDKRPAAQTGLATSG